VTVLYMWCLASNRAMQTLARHFEAEIKFEADQTTGRMVGRQLQLLLNVRRDLRMRRASQLPRSKYTGEKKGPRLCPSLSLLRPDWPRTFVRAWKLDLQH
jgi:hypothetical protein